MRTKQGKDDEGDRTFLFYLLLFNFLAWTASIFSLQLKPFQYINVLVYAGIHLNHSPTPTAYIYTEAFFCGGESSGGRLFSTASMLEWLRLSPPPTTHRGAVRKDAAELP